MTFRNPAGGSYYPSIEAPFTWTISTAHSRTDNSAVENVPGETEHWIVNDGIITDPNGRDVTATFRAGGETAKYGPLHFDFKAPAITENSEVVIAAHGAAAADWVSTTAIYYRDSGGNSARRFRITGMSDMGVGHVYGTTSAIAVGDYSAGRNSDASPNTAFAPIEGLDNVTHIHQLPEEDPNVDGVADGGGVDTYVAELQSLADRLGNSTWLGGGRIRTATHFGVDRTPPVISRERPAEALVLSGNSLFFEIEDPRLETGEDGSQPMATVHAYAGDSRYWVTSRHYWTSRPSTAGGSVTVDVTPDTDRFAREDTHVVYVRALDVAGNATSTSFTFVRDQTDPALSLSAVPSNFGATTAKSVSVTVAGTLSDATEIRRAFLSIHPGATCAEGDDALASSQVSGPIRRLDNGTNEIEFSEVFTVKQGDDLGATSYCFYLKAEDDARDADDRADANVYSAMVSTFSVGWPGTPPTAGPTFEFTNVDGTAIAEALEVTEGAGTGTAGAKMYAVKLANVATAPTAAAPLTVTLTPSAGVSTLVNGSAASTVTFPNPTDPTRDTVLVEVTAGHDLNIVSEMLSVNHSATGYEAASVAVQSMDEDFEVAVDVSSVDEDADAVEVTVTVTAGTAPATGATHSVALNLTPGGDAAAADFSATDKADAALAGTNELTLTIAAGMTSADSTIKVSAVDDTDQNEVNDLITVGPVAANPAAGQGLYVKPDEITINDADPDVMVTLDPGSFDETDDNVAIEVTATRPSGGGVVVVEIAAASTSECSAGTWSATTLTIDGGSGSSSVTETITVDGQGNFHGDDVTCEFVATISSDTPAKTSGTAYTVQTAELMIVNADDSTGN